ncbi:MAG: PhnD/SsuA/transferrin family substrate-binding protein [Gammaproteobacteria bacterium]|nr:PhnD/SsuA/transferrin family substrate-binding protein [Gammaproteobacteria bacterium]
MNIRYIRPLFLYTVFALIFFASCDAAATEDVRIALRANKGVKSGFEQWQATADFLSEKIPGYRFVMVPFENNSALNEAVSRGDFMFHLTNPASSVELGLRYGSQPLATLLNKRQGKGYAKFGSVIFTRADHDDLNDIPDLRDKTFIAVDELGFGGWRAAWGEMLNYDLNPYTDLKELRFAGGKQQDVVYAVKNGEVDAGSVRTDMLERLAKAGKINLNEFKILGRKKNPDFPFLHSTDLYPEWLFSATKYANPQLKNKVMSALFDIKSEDPAAIKGKYVAWISPEDYSPVNSLLKKLRVGPYSPSTMGTFELLYDEYKEQLISIALVVFLLVLTVLYMLSQNRQIKKGQKSLQAEIEIRKGLEQQLLQAHKMESLGRLTGGIAHDFNNLLASILGFTELAANEKVVQNNRELKEYLNYVLTSGDKAKLLVAQMLAFGRSEGNIEKPETLSVSTILDRLSQMMRPLIPSTINFRIENLNPELEVSVSPVMIEQVLVNLCLNAKDAIENASGSIVISSEVQEVKQVVCDSCHKEINGEYVGIRIIDTGRGIPDKDKLRVFEPFFSTKTIGKGSGMGLSMAHGIIHQHNGHILLSSKIDKGTDICLLLPAAVNTSRTTNKRDNTDNKEHPQSVANKKILLVDDEVSITLFLKELLKQHGFHVQAFNDSQEALAFFKENHNLIDLVITDQTMPGMSGFDMASTMKSYSEQVPIILCTGYSDQLEEGGLPNDPVFSVLQKPVATDVLLETIRAALSSKQVREKEIEDSLTV